MNYHELSSQKMKIDQIVTYMRQIINEEDADLRNQCFVLREQIRILAEIADSFDGVLPETL